MDPFFFLWLDNSEQQLSKLESLLRRYASSANVVRCGLQQVGLLVGVARTVGEKFRPLLYASKSNRLIHPMAKDDTVAFMDFSGGVYRLGLKNGTQIWRTPARESHDSRPAVPPTCA